MLKRPPCSNRKGVNALSRWAALLDRSDFEFHFCFGRRRGRCRRLFLRARRSRRSCDDRRKVHPPGHASRRKPLHGLAPYSCVSSLEPVRRGEGNSLVDVETLVREYGIATGIACVLDRERVGRPIGVQLNAKPLGGVWQIEQLIERLVWTLTWPGTEATRHSLRSVDLVRQLERLFPSRAICARLELIVEALPALGRCDARCGQDQKCSQGDEMRSHGTPFSHI